MRLCRDKFGLEERGKVMKELLFDYGGVYGATEFGLERGYALIGDAAGDDVFEVVKVGVYVEGEAVHCNPTA